MRFAKLYRRITLATLVLVGLATGGDVVALRVAESQAAAGFARATAAERASVGLGGFPFMLHLLTGRFPRMDFSATSLSGGGLRVAGVSARIEDVRFSAREAVALIRSPYARRTKVSATAPLGKLEIAEQDLTDFLRDRVESLRDCRISPSGVEVRFDVAGLPEPVSVRFLPRIEEQRLVLRLVGVAGLPKQVVERARSVERTLDLPPVPKGLRVEVTLGNGSIDLEATGPKIEVMIGEGGISS